MTSVVLGEKYVSFFSLRLAAFRELIKSAWLFLQFWIPFVEWITHSENWSSSRRKDAIVFLQSL
jgi:hypothetical protein